MTEPDAQLPTEIRREDLEVARYHTPIQPVNRGPVGVKMRHIPTGLVVDVAQRESAVENMALALDELRQLLIEDGHLAPRDEFPIEVAVDAAARARFFRKRAHSTMPDEDHMTTQQAWEKYADAYRNEVRPDVTAAATPIEVWARRRIAEQLRALYRPIAAAPGTFDEPSEPTEWDEAVHACVEIVLEGLDKTPEQQS